MTATPRRRERAQQREASPRSPPGSRRRSRAAAPRARSPGSPDVERLDGEPRELGLVELALARRADDVEVLVDEVGGRRPTRAAVLRRRAARRRGGGTSNSTARVISSRSSDAEPRRAPHLRSEALGPRRARARRRGAPRAARRCRRPARRRSPGAAASDARRARGLGRRSRTRTTTTERASGPAVGAPEPHRRARRAAGSPSCASGVSTSTSSGDQPRSSTRSATSSTIVVVLPVPGAPSTAADASSGRSTTARWLGSSRRPSTRGDRAHEARRRALEPDRPPCAPPYRPRTVARVLPTVNPAPGPHGIPYLRDVDIRIGIANSPRELAFETAQTSAEVEKIVSDALDSDAKFIKLVRRQGQGLHRADRLVLLPRGRQREVAQRRLRRLTLA